MTEVMRIIAETEGIVTPTHKRSQAEIDKAFSERAEKKAAKKASKPKSSAKTEKANRDAKANGNGKAPATAKPAAAKVSTQTGISREAIKVNGGNITTAGYDPKSKAMHIEFSKGNVYEYPGTEQKDWDAFAKTFADKDVVTGNYFRKEFRGRKYVRVSDAATIENKGAAEAAPAKSEVAK